MAYSSTIIIEQNVDLRYKTPTLYPMFTLPLDPTNEPELNAVWPSFLDLLDLNPKLARKKFADQMIRTITIHPLYQIPKWLKLGFGNIPEDAYGVIYSHCCDNNFEQLKKYKLINDRPWWIWFVHIANNRLLDDIRAELRRKEREMQIDNNNYKNKGNDPDIRTAWVELEELYLHCLENLTVHEKMLVELTTSGLKPRNIALIEGLKGTKKERKKISGQIKSAGIKLERCIKKLNSQLYLEWIAGRSKRKK